MRFARSIGVLLVLSAFAMLLTAECAEAEMGEISGGTTPWYYSGEVESAKVHGWIYGRFCNKTLCAHGKGSMGTDGGIYYTGTFVHGNMEGYGAYENDAYGYVGRFRNNFFDGSGALTCNCGVGKRYEGVFVDGRMKGLFKVTPPGKTQVFTGERMIHFSWPCNCF